MQKVEVFTCQTCGSPLQIGYSVKLKKPCDGIIGCGNCKEVVSIIPAFGAVLTKIIKEFNERKTNGPSARQIPEK